MATSVILPKQGQSVETCIITEWYKKKGDRVEKGELLFAYETDKSSFEEEARAEGILLEVYFGEGDEVPVLTEVAVIGQPGEVVPGRPDVPFVASGAPASPVSEPSGSPASPVIEPSGAPEGDSEPAAGDAKSGGRLKISPRARNMAEKKGIRVDELAGSGPNGRIIVRDIEAALAGVAAGVPGPVPEAVSETVPEAVSGSVEGLPSRPTLVSPETESPAPEDQRAEKESTPTPVPEMARDWQDRPLSNMRRLISRAMHASLQNSAQLTHHLGADARSILSLRSKVKKMRGEGYAHNITLNDMVCFALVRALKKHPGANVHFLGESIRYFRKIHLGIAVDTERGLMVPVLRNADDLSLAGLSNQIAQLAAACRSGKIDPDLLQPEAATFTVSNLGNYGVEMFTPVINLPQAAILGINTILERPARMEDGTFGFVPYLGLSLTYDHRALDGGPATLFLGEIKKEIEQFNHELINL
jgi:pyruvate dehydrogenase E2 component (dihydrolipoamide acetyltransferase)